MGQLERHGCVLVWEFLAGVVPVPQFASRSHIPHAAGRSAALPLLQTEEKYQGLIIYIPRGGLMRIGYMISTPLPSILSTALVGYSYMSNTIAAPGALLLLCT
jgi:hypothetical protein